jgi:micrococcal nuclease
MKNKYLGFLLLLFFSFQSVSEFQGKVISILDGDTIEVLTSDLKKVRIRLSGIDCPERSQAFGEAAKQFAASLCFQKNVLVKVHGKDQYGRTIGEIFLPDKQSLNQLIVQSGYAWHYKRYSSDKKLAILEEFAKQNKLGLWQHPNPTPPWEFRRKK